MKESLDGGSIIASWFSPKWEPKIDSSQSSIDVNTWVLLSQNDTSIKLVGKITNIDDNKYEISFPSSVKITSMGAIKKNYKKNAPIIINIITNINENTDFKNICNYNIPVH